MTAAKFHIVRQEDTNQKLINIYREYTNNFRFARGRKIINNGAASIDLNGVLYDIYKNELYFSGNYELYYNINADIIGQIKKFLTDDSQETILINDLELTKTDEVEIYI